MREKRIFGIIVIALILFAGSYFLVFNGGISSNSQSWSDFSNYISGMMMIVLTSINIYVFIKLTKAIDQNDEKRREQELDVQKLILLSELRQTELNLFNEILDNAMMVKFSLSEAESSESLIKAVTYIETFVNTKKHLFPIIEKEKIVEIIMRLHKQLMEIGRIWKENFPTLNDFDSKNLKPLNINAEILAFLKLKNEILSILQEFTIKELECKSTKL